MDYLFCCCVVVGRFRRKKYSSQLADGVAQDIDDPINLLILNDKGQAELNGVAAVANIETLLPALHGNFEGAASWLTGIGLDGQRPGEAVVANIADIARALEAVQRHLEERAHLLDALDEFLLLQNIQRGQGRDRKST